jgi:hypothetical protein
MTNTKNGNRVGKNESSTELYRSILGNMEMEWKKIAAEIDSVSHEIVLLLKPTNPKNLETIEGLQRCPYYFNPPEIYEVAKENSNLRKLLTYKKSLEKRLQKVERIIRFES